jgi:hypothetical protein
MVIWSGKGFIVALAVFGCSLLMELMTERAMGNDNFYQDCVWAFPLALVIGGAISSATSFVLPAEDRYRDTLFFVPLVWWGPLLAVIAAAIVICRMMAAA